MSNARAYQEPVEETYTEWYNPLDVPQYVDIFHDGQPRPTRYKWAPGETKPVPSRYDRAIHRVENGVIIAGLAPQLQKVGGDAKLDPALDTEGVKKRQAQVDAHRAALTKKAAEDAIIEATAAELEANKAIAAQLPPDAKKPRG